MNCTDDTHGRYFYQSDLKNNSGFREKLKAKCQSVQMKTTRSDQSLLLLRIN